MDGEFPPTYRDNYVSGKPLTGRYPRVRGWRGAFRGQPLSKNVSRSVNYRLLIPNKIIGFPVGVVGSSDTDIKCSRICRCVF